MHFSQEDNKISHSALVYFLIEHVKPTSHISHQMVKFPLKELPDFRIFSHHEFDSIVHIFKYNNNNKCSLLLLLVLHCCQLTSTDVYLIDENFKVMDGVYVVFSFVTEFDVVSVCNL